MAEKKVRLLDRDPRYPEAKQRLVELQLKRGELQARIQEILARPRQTNPFEEEADELLRSGALELQSRQARDDEELERLYHNIGVLESAIRKQQELIGQLTYEISKGISAEVKPAYIQKVRAVAEAALKLAECAQQERDFRESLIDDGVMLTFETLPFNSVGYSRDHYANANIYYREAKKAGYL